MSKRTYYKINNKNEHIYFFCFKLRARVRLFFTLSRKIWDIDNVIIKNKWKHRISI